MEIAPVHYSQILTGRGGELILVDDDVQNVARDLHEIDRNLRLMFNERGEYWVVYRLHTHQDGRVSEDLVTTAKELDQRIVARVRKVAHESYNLADELDRLEDERKREQDREFSEYIGDTAEQLGFAMRKDLGKNDHRIFLPRGVAA